MREGVHLIITLMAIAIVLVVIVFFIPSEKSPPKIPQDKQADAKETTIQGAAIDGKQQEDEKETEGNGFPTTKLEETGKNIHECTPESKLVEICEPIDNPVCGWYDTQISCSWGPCSRSTFPNKCEACRTPHVFYWTEGDCPLHG